MTTASKPSAANGRSVARPIIVVGNDYPAGQLHAPHRHRRDQLLHGSIGSMIVTTEHGSWVIPPQHGIWIPGGVQHGIRMVGNVSTRSAYVEPQAAPGLPATCRVVAVSRLLAQLLLDAVDLPVEYAAGSRDEMLMMLLLREVRDAPQVPLGVRCPTERRLHERCRHFLLHPAPHDTIDDWCTAVGMSRRAFTRLFRRETGLSFAKWKRQACLLAAIPRLAAGEHVTTIALDLGYSGSPSFSSMFRRTLGKPPSHFLPPR